MISCPHFENDLGFCVVWVLGVWDGVAMASSGMKMAIDVKDRVELERLPENQG